MLCHAWGHQCHTLALHPLCRRGLCHVMHATLWPSIHGPFNLLLLQHLPSDFKHILLIVCNSLNNHKRKHEYDEAYAYA